MKKLKSDPSKLRSRAEWDSFMHSTHENMSEGARQVDKIITRAHKDNWRRKNVRKSKKAKTK